MAKFFSYLAVLAVAVFGANAEEQASECRQLNFVEKSADFDQINGLISFAVNSGILKGLLGKYDPLDIEGKTLDAIPFNVFHLDFELTPTIESLNVKGVSTVAPRALNVSTPVSLELGADFNGELNMDATISLEIRQLNKKWYNICWTSPFKPKSCPPKVITMDVNLGMINPTLFTHTVVDMLQCPENADNCKDITIADLYAAALSQKFDELLARILLRIREVAVRDIDFRFDEITDLGLHFHSSGPLVTQIGRKFFGFSKEELNKKGDVYNLVMGVVDKILRTLANKVIGDKLSPKFGHTCFDV